MTSIGNSQRMQLEGTAEIKLLAVCDSRLTLQITTTELKLDDRSVDSVHRRQALIVDADDGSVLRQRVEGEVEQRERKLFRGIVDSSLKFRTTVELVAPGG